MLQKLSHSWSMFALRGMIAIIFGVIALIRPEQTTQALVLVFGAFALVDGITTIFAGLGSAPFFSRWWVLALEGGVGVAVGLFAIFSPEITTRALLYAIAAWAVITGTLGIVVAIEFRRVLEDEWMLVLGGLFSIVFGVLLVVFPAAGELSVIWLIGIYAMAFGIAEMIFAFRLHGLQSDFEKSIQSQQSQA